MRKHIEYRGAVIWKYDSTRQSHSWKHLETLDRVLLEHYILQVKFFEEHSVEKLEGNLDRLDLSFGVATFH